MQSTTSMKTIWIAEYLFSWGESKNRHWRCFQQMFQSRFVCPPGPCSLCSISLETRLKERDILELTVTERRTKEEKYALSLPMPVRPNLMTFLSRICPLQNSMQWVCQLFLPFNNKTNAMRHLSNIFLSRKSFTENTLKVLIFAIYAIKYLCIFGSMHDEVSKPKAKIYHIPFCAFLLNLLATFMMISLIA